MNQKCNTLQGSSITACSLKILCGERANELGRTWGETERRQKFLRTIFAFITLETTKVIGRVLPSTNHLLFYDGPCDLSVASSCFDDTQISFFSSKNSDTKIFFAAPLYRDITYRRYVSRRPGYNTALLITAATIHNLRKVKMCY